MYYFSLVCLLSWSLQFPIVVNLFEQWLQWYGFSPVWVLICTKRFPFSAKIFKQFLCGHSNGLSSEWKELMWRSSLEALEKDLKHPPIGHVNLLRLLCEASWCLRCYLSLKVLPQLSSVHVYSLFGSFK